MGVNEVFKSYFFKQLQQDMDSGKIVAIHPLHYVINIIAMCVFPFIAAPLLKHIAKMDSKQYKVLTDQRTVLVPKWMRAIMRTK